MTPLSITDYTLSTCIGSGKAANWQAIREQRSGLQPCMFEDIRDLSTWVGQMAALETPISGHLQDYDCRNNRLAWLALNQDNFLANIQQKIQRIGASRVGIFLGSSTSGIHQTELAYFESREVLPEWYNYQKTHNAFSLVDFVRAVFQTTGPAIAISTACSSSAKVFASAQRYIQAGLCDAAIVGGVDTLCLTTLYGFNALQLLSPTPCAPFDVNRAGISIGEAGGFAFLEKDVEEAPHYLLGYGESGDAYHMSSPHPEGEGAQLAMRAALARAGLSAADIHYINLHGTGTQANDSAESKAVHAVFGSQTPASSTKGWTGHTLGAAGIVEVALSLLAIEQSYIPGNLHLQNLDPVADLAIAREGKAKSLQRVLSNSFGFGGSNCSLVLGT
ncbi:beta-ketoacyl-[acyl-carrier-protein] synthase family protein [Cellvibrio sp.]|uniref:beta-ketoacyl-[acyl-carrier-protein] synthase family protein n=1 Tax=Cellvibrio sp. TaxID=1965322 RepID=UPI0039648342